MHNFHILTSMLSWHSVVISGNEHPLCSTNSRQCWRTRCDSPYGHSDGYVCHITTGSLLYWPWCISAVLLQCIHLLQHHLPLRQFLVVGSYQFVLPDELLAEFVALFSENALRSMRMDKQPFLKKECLKVSSQCHETSHFLLLLLPHGISTSFLVRHELVLQS